MKLNGAEILINSLKKEGVKHIFGYPGGAVLHIYDALAAQEDITHILVRHEQGAAHAADGYARTSGKPGVVLVTSGPGITNAVTGIATANMDSIPMVVISGQVPSPLIGNDAFQEVDAVGITRSCVKHNFLIKDISEVAITVKKAFHIATTGRPGPVVIDIPKDVTINQMELEEYPETIKMRSYKPTTKASNRQIKKAAELIANSQRPILYSGGGSVIGNASKELRELTRLLGFPITQTLMGLGAYPGTDELSIGMLGMHGTYEANMAMHYCDVLLGIGVRFDDRVTNSDISKFCPDATVLHVDIDPASISKTVNADVPIVGSVTSVLEEMLAEIGNSKSGVDKQVLEVWWKQIDQWRQKDSLAISSAEDGSIKPQQVVQAVYEITKGDAFVSSDVGQHQMFAAQYYRFDKPRRWINSGGLGTMGFGFPAAMGVQFAHPDAVSVCITGEGSFQMNLQEFATCMQYQLPIKIICLNNQALGMVKQWQDMQYGGRPSHSTYAESLPDFTKLAEAYGHVGIKITKLSELQSKLEEAFAHKDKLVFVDVMVDPDEHVYPMAIKGGAMKDMILSKSERT